MTGQIGPGIEGALVSRPTDEYLMKRSGQKVGRQSGFDNGAVCIL